MAKIIDTSALRSSLRAASLVEVTIAMVIIAAVFSIGIMVIVNVTQSGRSLERLKAGFLANQVATEAINGKRFYDEDIQRESFVVRKIVSEYPGIDGLLVLECSVWLGDKQMIVTRKQLVRHD